VNRLRKLAVLLLTTAVAGCGHHRAPPHVGISALTATPKTLDSLWDAGMDYYRRHKWEKAANTFDRVELELPPGDHRALQARLYLGELYVRTGSNLQAVREYRRLVDEFPTDSLAPEALLDAGNAYFALWRGADLDPTYGITAQSVYAEVLTRYPNTPAAAKATGKIRELDDRFALKDYRAAKFYAKLKAYESATIGYKQLLLDHGKSAIAPQAMSDLINVYRKLGYAEDLHDMCALLQRDWKDTPQAKATDCTTPVAIVLTRETHPAGLPLGPARPMRTGH
jgi:outer membrane assembly lipoprotein YfiO